MDFCLFFLSCTPFHSSILSLPLSFFKFAGMSLWNGSSICNTPGFSRFQRQEDLYCLLWAVWGLAKVPFINSLPEESLTGQDVVCMSVGVCLCGGVWHSATPSAEALSETISVLLIDLDNFITSAKNSDSLYDTAQFFTGWHSGDMG